MQISMIRFSSTLNQLRSGYYFSSLKSKEFFLVGRVVLTEKDSKQYVVQLKLQQKDKFKIIKKQVCIQKNAAIAYLKQLINNELGTTGIKVICDEGYEIAQECQIQSLKQKLFYLSNENDETVAVNWRDNRQQVVKGQSLAYLQLKNIELSAVQRMQLQSYLLRVEIWLKARYGKGYEQHNFSIPREEAKLVLVQALVDPTLPYLTLLSRYERWRKMEVEVQALRALRDKARQASESSANIRMCAELVVLVLNINFIWAGTYVYFSWDIIEPIAYFTSSAASIYLLNQFRNTRKIYSSSTYKQFLTRQYLPSACAKLGLNLEYLESKEKILVVEEQLWKTQFAALL